jgi:peptide/nickel transport system permease protein
MTTASAELRPLLEAERIESVEVGQYKAIWRRLRRHHFAVLGAVVLGILAAVAILAPVIAPGGYDEQNLFQRYGLPSPTHPLGTDDLGRDVLVRLIYGARISLTVASIATLLATLFGMLVGASAGYLGGVVEVVNMRIADIMLSLPALPLLIIFSAALGPGLTTIVFVLTLFGWMGVARLAHGAVLALRHREFTEAARALGGGAWHNIIVHMIPNALAPILVSATLGFGSRVIAEATLSFLGLGISPPIPSWGNMLTNAQGYIWSQPWLAVYPGACIFIAVLAINFLGDGLRDALDPRLKI